ncbi:hypothetical protein [Planctomyces sp. SH-PL14]|uniref:hypothetical protein n=1 Tax=Planctomyces sp. SH-PL14 TaxID=1632864 RepID=UPI00078B5DFF|nr:hypothetical protein [Planctomyces sp. SH-PL14]AMV19625.1 Replication initiation factor [Planctomyces sp. SH-PL14]
MSPLEDGQNWSAQQGCHGDGSGDVLHERERSNGAEHGTEQPSPLSADSGPAGGEERRAATLGAIELSGGDCWESLLEEEEDAVETGSPITSGLNISVPGECSYLAHGIDSLDIGIYGQFGPMRWQQLEGELTKLKESAKNTRGVLHPSIPGCLVLAHGKRFYEWQLTLPEFHIFIRRSESANGQAPKVMAALDSSLLWKHGVHGAVGLVLEQVTQLGMSIDRVQVSRCDVCADFHIPGGLDDQALRTLLVPRNLKYRVFGKKRMETFHVGAGTSSIQCRIYDKTKEIIKSKKEWFYDIWKLERAEDVWRVEFQLRREALKSFQIDSLDDLDKKLGGLWKALTTLCISFRHRDNKNVSRRTVIPMWAKVQDVASRFGEVSELRRINPQPRADLKGALAQLWGRFVSVCAFFGITDLKEGLAVVLMLLENYSKAERFGELVAIRMVLFGVSEDTEGDE